MAIYAADGSINVVDDSGTGRYNGDGKLRVQEAVSEFGVYAPDGALLIEIVEPTDTPFGLYNARGNFRVVDASVDSDTGFYAPNGAMRATGLVTIATGPGAGVGEGMGLLLTLTQA
jgi:hypothetical protein